MDYNPGYGFEQQNNSGDYGENHQNNPNQNPSGDYGYNRGYESSGLKTPHYVDRTVWLNERNNIRRLSVMTGIAIILYIVFSNVLVGVVQGIFAMLTKSGVDYSSFATVWNSAYMQYLINILYSVAIVGGPYFIIRAVENKHHFSAEIPMGKPKNLKNLPLIIFGAFGVCLIGNIITSYVSSIIENVFNVDLALSDDITMPRNALGVILYIVCTAVVPAFIEEMSLRGIVMQPLRRYGDTYAILVTAMVFALMHCNLVQIPFAFVAGIAIGYAVIATESIWTGIIIHFINNMFSVLTTIIADVYGYYSKAYIVCLVFFYAFIAIGVVCSIWYFKKTDHAKLNKSPLVNAGRNYIGVNPYPYSAQISNSKLFGTFIATVPMVIAILAIIYETVAAIAM